MCLGVLFAGIAVQLPRPPHPPPPPPPPPPPTGPRGGRRPPHNTPPPPASQQRQHGQRRSKGSSSGSRSGNSKKGRASKVPADTHTSAGQEACAAAAPSLGGRQAPATQHPSHQAPTQPPSPEVAAAAPFLALLQLAGCGRGVVDTAVTATLCHPQRLSDWRGRCSLTARLLRYSRLWHSSLHSSSRQGTWRCCIA
jgi:hypothetical protein